MNLIETINLRKAELEEVIKEFNEATYRISHLQNEIAELEYRVRSEKINNPVACLNPIMFEEKKCGACGFYERCAYRHKGDYGRFKL